MRDPRVKDVTITGVEVSGDLQHATIYYSILSDKASDEKKVQTGLDKATSLIRGELGHRLSIYVTPEIKFERDKSVQYGDCIDEPENFTVQINFSIFKKVFKRVWLLNRTLFFFGRF